ncbi:SseB family protein [Aliiroseovarius lamellibrachiae]|uniref:SseB family protein n=1 Tax=Aliiroseovarius lamellibrachiae TaxID=1924933 RepID=UPI001BE0213D|nr:SseB family protein [Aliiroseovarius lamellibrachiae]MBT2129926.1 SseB family protein [Aliiroseovarius lamellibrachiae]
MTTTETQLDQAHALMSNNLDDDAARLRFYERLADGELFLLLAREAAGSDDEIEPELFELEDDTYVLVFDREERLAEFVGKPAPYAALPGRIVARMLAGQDIGLGVNLSVAPSSILIPPPAVDWLAATLEGAPEEVVAQVTEIKAPSAPEALIAALDAKLASAAGLASCACLAGVTYSDGRKGHVLGFIDAAEGAYNALAGAANEALTFSGVEAGEMDVGFFASEDVMAQKLVAYGLKFDLPMPETPEPLKPIAPGSDPEKPPILK